jgi:DNA polymerase III delta prime subunit
VKLIPNICISNSEGEKVLFDKLQNKNVLEGSIGLHSLNISNHHTQAEGEADFVLLLPNKGILVVEVKDHTKVSYENGKWILGNNPPEVGGPIKQAKEACYSIIDFVKSNLKASSRVPIAYCVWFTKSDFKPATSIEWESWQFLNIEDLDDVESSISKTMESAILNFKSKKETRFIDPNVFNQEVIDQVANLLRPKFEYLLSESVLRNLRRQELTRLLDDQYEAIDGMEENTRVLISGPAGTGKTLLGIEKLRRLKAEGKKAKFICFNTFLASALSAKNLDLDIENISKLIYRFAQEAEVDNSEIRVIEDQGPSSLGSNLKIEEFDALVIDEAQDLMNEKYLPWLNVILKDGLNNGEWYAFGDFDSQNLYSSTNHLQVLNRFAKNFTNYKLKHNCRNLPLIGHLTYSVVPSAPKWKTFRRKDDGVDPIISYTGDKPWDIRYLDDAIDYFRKEKFSYPDIVILTPNRIANPSETFSQSKYADKFANWAVSKENRIRFSTIHSFKGLDSPCILLLELYELKNMPDFENLKYVALTRATDRLYIVANSATEKVLERR